MTDVRLTVSHEHTPIMLRSTWWRATGRHLRLKPYDEIRGLQMTDQSVTLSVVTFKFRETAREVTFSNRGTKLVSYSYATGTVSEMIIWDEAFTERVEVLYNRRTPEEVADKHLWEDICARPGDGSRFGQRDSAPRAEQRREDAEMTEQHLTTLFYASAESKTCR